MLQANAIGTVSACSSAKSRLAHSPGAAINYDLAKALQRERLAKSLSEFETRRHSPLPVVAPGPEGAKGADVIELVFSSHCETDQIGA